MPQHTSNMFNVDNAEPGEAVRRSPSRALRIQPIRPADPANSPIQTIRPADPYPIKVNNVHPYPLSNLLSQLGMNSRPRDEVQVGRDKSFSIMGMPVGQRDGLELSPMAGMSFGNVDMFGPVALNDKFNVRWDFLDKIGSMFKSQR